MVFFYGLSQELYFHYIGVSTLLERAGRVILSLFKIKIEISKKWSKIRNTEKKTLNANYPVLTCMIMYELNWCMITLHVPLQDLNAIIYTFFLPNRDAKWRNQGSHHPTETFVLPTSNWSKMCTPHCNNIFQPKAKLLAIYNTENIHEPVRSCFTHVE